MSTRWTHAILLEHFLSQIKNRHLEIVFKMYMVYIHSGDVRVIRNFNSKSQIYCTV